MLAKDSEWYHERQQYVESPDDAPPPTCPECGEKSESGGCPACGFPYRPYPPIGPGGEYVNPVDDSTIPC